MRGGAQSHLIQADDGQFYVVKFRNNPQHRRILVNEWVASAFLRHLRISTPETALIRLSQVFLERNCEIGFELGTRKLAAEPGWHFGSRYPGDPDRVAVYDFLPDSLLGQVVNLREFLGMLVVDKWVANADGRQAVFFRARLNEFLRPGLPGRSRQDAERIGFVAWMIDQGFAFNGPYWDFPDSPLQGLYHRQSVYEQVRGLDGFQPWLDQVVHFPEDVIDLAYKQIPPEWIEGEEEAFEKLLETLLRRRPRIPDLLAACRNARPSLFPHWS